MTPTKRYSSTPRAYGWEIVLWNRQQSSGGCAGGVSWPVGLKEVGKVQRTIVALQDPMVVWLSGNALVAINEVTLVRQARLILGWVTVCGQVHHLGM